VESDSADTPSATLQKPVSDWRLDDAGLGCRHQRAATPDKCAALLRLIKGFIAISGRLYFQPEEQQLRTLFTNLIKDQSGVTAIEYGLIAALIAVAAIAAMSLVGTGLKDTFTAIASSL
jgi:pilus assembly protein Flp/PilA